MMTVWAARLAGAVLFSVFACGAARAHEPHGEAAAPQRIESSGVSTAPIREAAEAFLDSLPPRLRRLANPPVDSPAWRDWNYIAIYPHGPVSLADLDATQRERAYDLMRASLSHIGFQKSRDIMRLNAALGDMIGHSGIYRTELGYFLTVFGTPHESEPWGWQIEGHHLVLNFMIVGDRISATPAFVGSNPTIDPSNPAAQSIFTEEEDAAFALVTSLSQDQRAIAVIAAEKPNEIFTGAGRDDFELRFEGLRYADMSPDQQRQLVALIGVYVRNIRPGHDRIRMDEISARLDETYFAWAGGIEPGGVFYYRVHSPVVLIEFDHQRPDSGRARDHVHTIVRTPNGGDYGADLLREHHERHDRDGEHAH